MMERGGSLMGGEEGDGWQTKGKLKGGESRGIDNGRNGGQWYTGDKVCME